MATISLCMIVKNEEAVLARCLDSIADLMDEIIIVDTADADEVLDDFNHERFLRLKNALLPEIEIVQMKYVTDADFDTVLNAKKEYRPKLFKRLRTFTWVDPVHETVRLTPVIFDSDVEILHKPQNFHSKRDFSIFIKNFQSGHELSPKIRTMYAKELLKTGFPVYFRT